MAEPTGNGTRAGIAAVPENDVGPPPAESATYTVTADGMTTYIFGPLRTQVGILLGGAPVVLAGTTLVGGVSPTGGYAVLSGGTTTGIPPPTLVPCAIGAIPLIRCDVGAFEVQP